MRQANSAARRASGAYVIVAPTYRGHGVLPIAQSGRTSPLVRFTGSPRYFHSQKTCLLKQFEKQQKSLNPDVPHESTLHYSKE